MITIALIDEKTIQVVQKGQDDQTDQKDQGDHSDQGDKGDHEDQGTEWTTATKKTERRLKCPNMNTSVSFY